ncbi:Nicotianamine synthase [Gongronella butleri]|nr:Nicotianamine synthase [Gongronella butleri]
MVHHLTSVSPPLSPPQPEKHAVAASAGMIKEIVHIHRQLSLAAPALGPSEHINALFTKLVQICILPVDDDTLCHVMQDAQIRPLQPHLRALCSCGEAMLESTWAKRLLVPHNVICRTLHANEALWQAKVRCHCSKFPYLQNYVDLARLEAHALLAVGASLARIAFIGSGPLPLSSIELLCQFPDKIERIDNVDMDRDAIHAAEGLVRNSLPWPQEIGNRVFNLNFSARQFFAYSQADVVFLGALVVDDDNDSNNGDGAASKLSIIEHIARQMKPNAHLLIRSAHGLRQLLYPAIRPAHLHASTELHSILEVVIELHPHNDVVNSIIIAKRI